MISCCDSRRTSVNQFQMWSRSCSLGRMVALVRLHEVADIGPEQASNLISRQNAQRKTIISANVAVGYNLGDTVAAIKKVLILLFRKSAYTVEYGGQFEAQQSASKTLLGMGVLILIAMVMLLQMALGQSTPCASCSCQFTIGYDWRCHCHVHCRIRKSISNFLALFGGGGRYIAPVVSIASLVGFITLFGIAVRNGILLVNHFKWLIQHENLDLIDA